MSAAVQSVEDHGYVMDIGIQGVRSFMTKETNGDLVIGQLVQCYITQCQVDGHIATLTLSTESSIKFKQNVELNISTLIPGTKVHVNVKKVGCLPLSWCSLVIALSLQVTQQGLQVTFGNVIGYVHKDHLPQPLDMSCYSKNPNLVAVVLYTLPLVNAVYLSLKPSLVNPEKNCGQLESMLSRIFDSAIVVEATSVGLFVQLKKNAMGFVPLRHLDDNKDAVEDIRAHHPVKSRKRCRVLQYSSLDDIYICTMKK